MTPKQSEIVEKATELWHEDRASKGDPSFDVTPTLAELREEGFLVAAQSELMRSSGHEWQIFLEEQAQCKSCLKPNILEGKLPLDFNECKKSNILISGTNQMGKSLAAMAISDLLMCQGWQVLTFDNCGIWKEKSSILNSFVVRQKKDRIRIKSGQSLVFDISLLKPKDQRKFVEQILEQIWMFRVLEKPTQWLMLTFEEFQLYARFVRGNDAQNILRMMSVGANHKIRCLGITPDLSLIDCAFIRLAQQRYHFRLGNEPNAKRRFRAYYGQDWTRVCTELDTGYCMYWNTGKAGVVKVPLFRPERLISNPMKLMY